jgi:hypothetical protein
MAVFWDVAPCSMMEIDRRFRGAYCLHHLDDESYQTGRRNIPEDSHLHTRRRENLKSQSCVRRRGQPSAYPGFGLTRADETPSGDCGHEVRRLPFLST